MTSTAACTRAVYQLVIEQGPIQIWKSDYIPDDQTQWVPKEFHGTLKFAGLFPGDIVERDEASALRQLISRRRNHPPEIEKRTLSVATDMLNPVRCNASAR